MWASSPPTTTCSRPTSRTRPTRSSSATTRARSAPPRRWPAACPPCATASRRARPGMELSLFSRDVIALSTAVALSHNVFDAALFLGICDKIVPGLFMGALQFGHLPHRVRARRPDDLRPVQRRKGQGAPAVRARPGGPRRLAGERSAGLPQPRHLHLLRHRQLQPDADGDHGPAPARRQLRQSRHAAARRAHARSGAARGDQHRAHRQRGHLPGRHRVAKRPSSTPSSACWPPAARPTTPCTWWPWRARPAC